MGAILKSKSVTAVLNTVTFEANLNSSINAAVTTIPVDEVWGLINFATCTASIDDEDITWTGIDTVNKTITGVTRGVGASIAAVHDANATITITDTIGATDNSVDYLYFTDLTGDQLSVNITYLTATGDVDTGLTFTYANKHHKEAKEPEFNKLCYIDGSGNITPLEHKVAVGTDNVAFSYNFIVPINKSDSVLRITIGYDAAASGSPVSDVYVDAQFAVNETRT